MSQAPRSWLDLEQRRANKALARAYVPHETYSLPLSPALRMNLNDGDGLTLGDVSRHNATLPCMRRVAGGLVDINSPKPQPTALIHSVLAAGA
jgi:hypothetical protein